MPLAVGRPLRVARDGRGYVTLLHPPGGIVGGDQLDIDIAVQSGARCTATTTAATKIYRSESEPSVVRTQLRVEEGGDLEWLPQETIVFDGARVRSRLDVRLAPGATWLAWDITRFGRTARGESFGSGTWSSHAVVRRDGVPLWIDRQRVDGGSTGMQSPHGLGGASVIGHLVSIGAPCDDATIEAARRFGDSAGGRCGVSRLEHGLICRYLGGSTAEAATWFRAVRGALRPRSSDSLRSVERYWNLDAASEGGLAHG